MTFGEIYEAKRKKFVIKTLEYFNFLCTDYSFDRPEHEKSIQENGVILKDSLKYNNNINDRLIIISNAYHPIDYGFEICFYIPSKSTKHSDRKIVYHVLKENQDIEQTYLTEAAIILKRDFDSQIKGESWI